MIDEIVDPKIERGVILKIVKKKTKRIRTWLIGGEKLDFLI